MNNHTNNSTNSYTQRISNENLFVLCKNYGEKARYFRQKFIGLLPEVHKRKLYDKKGFGSIFEFAAKLCGLSEEQVRTALNLEKDFEDKPFLKKLLVTGEVSINKLVRIQSIATAETQEFWATQVQLLPSRALETLVRDERKIASKNHNQNGLQELSFQVDELHVQLVNKQICSPNLSETVQERLLKLQEKGIDINELLTKLLDQHEEAIQAEKAQITKEMSEKVDNNSSPKLSRYIPAKIKKVLTQEHGTKCSIPTCQKPSQQIHHTQRYALLHKENSAPAASAHDPRYLAPLCRDHHKIAHSIDIQYHEVRQMVIR